MFVCVVSPKAERERRKTTCTGHAAGCAVDSHGATDTFILPYEENAMHRGPHLVLGIVGLMLLVGVSQSWGGPPNNDVSDALGNTAGGTAALFSNTTGLYNTAFGFNALVSNSSGIYNTATG